MTYDLAGKRVWVAGHRGMVGGAIARRLADEQCEVLTVGRETLDLTDQRAVPRAQGFGINALAQQNNTEAARQLLKNVQPGDAILVKASRGMKFEEIIETYFAQYGK